MMRQPDKILPGVVLMLAFCMIAPLLDVSSKLASASIPVAQIVTARFIVQSALMLPVVLVMGGVGYGVYTMALVELGNRFKGATLVAGNSAFALMWGAGGIVGPPGSGLVMQVAGPVGMPVLLATLGSCLVAFALLRSLYRR